MSNQIFNPLPKPELVSKEKRSGNPRIYKKYI